MILYLLKELEQFKHSWSTKSIIPQNIISNVKCCNHWQKRKSQTNYRYLESTTRISLTIQFFVVNLRLLTSKVRKTSTFLFLDMTLTSYMGVAFKKSTKFYCSQAAKTIKSKCVVKDQILLTVTTNFSLLFKFLFSSNKNINSEISRGPSYRMFSTVLA